MPPKPYDPRRRPKARKRPAAAGGGVPPRPLTDVSAVRAIVDDIIIPEIRWPPRPSPLPPLHIPMRRSVAERRLKQIDDKIDQTQQIDIYTV